MPLSESWSEWALIMLAESMAYLMEAHTSLILAHEDAQGRLEDSFAAAFELIEELSCEMALLERRMVYEKGH